MDADVQERAEKLIHKLAEEVHLLVKKYSDENREDIPQGLMLAAAVMYVEEDFERFGEEVEA